MREHIVDRGPRFSTPKPVVRLLREISDTGESAAADEQAAEWNGDQAHTVDDGNPSHENEHRQHMREFLFVHAAHEP